MSGGNNEGAALAAPIPSPESHKTACSVAGAQLDADHSKVFTSDISEQKDVCVAHTRQLREQTNVVVVQDADQTKRKPAVFDAVKCVADHKVAHIDAPIGTLARPLKSMQTDAHQAATQTNVHQLKKGGSLAFEDHLAPAATSEGVSRGRATNDRDTLCEPISRSPQSNMRKV